MSRCRTLTNAQLGALLHYASRMNRPAYAHVWALMFLLGLTPSEVVALRFVHLRRSMGISTVQVPTTRLRTHDWAPVPTLEVPVLGSEAVVAAAFALDADYRRSLPVSSYLFPSRDDPDAPLSPYSVVHRFRAHTVGAGLPGDLVPSSLRETGAARVRRASRERAIVARWKRLRRGRDVLHSTWRELRGCLDLPPIVPLPPSDQAVQLTAGLEDRT